MKYLFAIVLFISGCASVGWDDQRVGINFSAQEYNDLLNKFHKRPTFATITTFRGSGKQTLSIFMEKYWVKYKGAESNIVFAKEYVHEYIALIDKYLEWETVARRDHDIIDKKIGEASSQGLDIEFSIYSGNEVNHFLAIGRLGGYSQYYRRGDAEKLKAFLEKFADGNINKVDESKYN